jgi:hypothetical protein
MCNIEINEGGKSLKIVLKTHNFTALENEKSRLAFQQFMLKSNGMKKKFERRIKRILKEGENAKSE